MEQYQLLEIDLSKWIETEPENVVVCSSGTAALHLAIESLEVYNSCILLSDYNMIACARAIALSGSYPRLGDFNLNLLINPGKFPDVQSQTARISAIMPVHIYGRRCDMDIIHRKAEQYQCSVIEDMAEIHGVKPHAKSHAACWSFYKNKIVAGEEGGAVWFKDSKIAQRARMLRSLGFTEDHDFRHIPRGMNYRLSNANAAIIRRSLAFFEENVYDRIALLEEYDRLIPPEWKMPKRESPWVYDLRIPGLTYEKQREIVKYLNAEGHAARCGFVPISMQSEFAKFGTISSNSKTVPQEVFYLPLNPVMTFPEVRRIVEALLKAV